MSAVLSTFEVTMRTHPYSISLTLAMVGIVTLLAGACGDTHPSPSGPSPASAVGSGTTAGASTAVSSTDDVTADVADAIGETMSATGANTAAVCHLVGNGSYHLLHVNPHALQAHMNHGDVLPQGRACPPTLTTTVGR
jgi:hypothetical protein